MTLWVAIALAAGIAFATKLAGHLIPAHLLSGPRTRRVMGAMPVALLAALVATQTFTGEARTLVIDARLAAVGVAVVALALRAPFILVVMAGAATAALLRWLGWG